MGWPWRDNSHEDQSAPGGRQNSVPNKEVTPGMGPTLHLMHSKTIAVHFTGTHYRYSYTDDWLKILMKIQHKGS